MLFGEREVLVTSVNGATIGEVARKLYLSEGTVRNRVEAAHLAEREGCKERCLSSAWSFSAAG
jgi:DNA-binding NarL/FixJ family response regulator